MESGFLKKSCVNRTDLGSFFVSSIMFVMNEMNGVDEFEYLHRPFDSWYQSVLMYRLQLILSGPL